MLDENVQEVMDEAVGKIGDIGREGLIHALNHAMNDTNPTTVGRGEQEEVAKGAEQKRTPSSSASVEQEPSYSALLANPALSLVSHRVCV